MEWDWSLVKGVSRSFYISLRFLPASIREGVALAYLLARASDTLADSGNVVLETRMRCLQAICREKWEEGFQSEYRNGGLKGSEGKLLENIPELLSRLEKHPDADLIREVFQTIVSGQMKDLEYFSPPNQGPLSPEALEDYTWRVAGCVGKFWTRICFRHLPHVAKLPEEKMIELGIEYGKGLQLVNILRDRNEDLSVGRNYFEQEEDVIERAGKALDSGHRYVVALRNIRIRFCSRMPYEIALPTLAAICRGQDSQPVRISRVKVYGLMMRCLFDAVLQPQR